MGEIRWNKASELLGKKVLVEHPLVTLVHGVLLIRTLQILNPSDKYFHREDQR